MIKGNDVDDVTLPYTELLGEQNALSSKLSFIIVQIFKSKKP